jgi:hypothetical protein
MAAPSSRRGSIAWVCALSHNNYDNNISRLANKRLLKRFPSDDRTAF